jgi:hypothetical protein
MPPISVEEGVMDHTITNGKMVESDQIEDTSSVDKSGEFSEERVHLTDKEVRFPKRHTSSTS